GQRKFGLVHAAQEAQAAKRLSAEAGLPPGDRAAVQSDVFGHVRSIIGSPMPVKRKPRRKKAAPKSKGLTPAECRLEDTSVIKPLIERIDRDGGAVLACF